MLTVLDPLTVAGKTGVLVVHTGPPTAVAWEGMETDNDAKREVLAVLQGMFPQQQHPPVADLLVDFDRTDWRAGVTLLRIISGCTTSQQFSMHNIMPHNRCTQIRSRGARTRTCQSTP